MASLYISLRVGLRKGEARDIIALVILINSILLLIVST